MNIYTRKGDFGQTTNVQGESLSKSSPLLSLQGTIDEVNSCIGHLRSLMKKSATSLDGSSAHSLQKLDTSLKERQFQLYLIGTDISNNFVTQQISPEMTTHLEEQIDSMLLATGELRDFIYLSGHESATYAHVLRSVIRRAEREFVTYIEASQCTVVPEDYKFINRLADYVFQLARYLNHLFKIEEEVYHIN